MKINFSKLYEEGRHLHPGNESWMYYFLLHVLTEHTSNANEWKEMLDVDISKLPDGGLELDMRVTVNGHDVPFEAWFEVMKNEYLKNVKNHAEKIIEEKLGNLQEKLNTLELEAKEAIRNAVDAEAGEVVYGSWVLNQLAGMEFPEKGGAYDFMKKCLGKT